MTRRTVVLIVVVVIFTVALLLLYLFNQPTEVTGYAAMGLRSV